MSTEKTELQQEKTKQYQGLFTSLLTEFKTLNTGVLCLSEANFKILQGLNERMPTAVLSCKALVSQLMAYKKAALVPAEKQPVHELITKILFTFMAFQENAEQKALVELLTPLFPKGQDEEWDKLLLNLQSMIATELPSSQPVQGVSTLATGYQTFIQTLLNFKGQAPSLPFNETFIVSLLIAGAEKAQSYAEKDQKGILSFTDEEKIKAFIQKFDLTLPTVLSDIYARSLLRSQFIDFLQKKSFPLAKKLKALEEGFKTQVNANLQILEKVDGQAEYEGFYASSTPLQARLAALCNEYEAIQVEANACLKNPELLKQGPGQTFTKKDELEQKLAVIEQKYNALAEDIKTCQDILNQRMIVLSEAKQRAYQELTASFEVLNRAFNQSLYQVIALKLVFSDAKKNQLIPLTQEDDASYAQKVTSVAEKFTVVEQQIGLLKLSQAQQAALVDSKMSAPKFAKCTLIQQYQIYATFSKSFEALRKTFNESPLALSNPVEELKEIKKSFENRIKTSQESLEKNRSQLVLLLNEKASLDQEKTELANAIVEIFKNKLNVQDLMPSNAFDALNQKISEIRKQQINLTENHPNLVENLKTSYEALSNEIQAHLKTLDGDFYPVLKDLVEIILWLFWKEDLPEDSWLMGLKAFSDKQENLKKEIDLENTLKRYLSTDLDDITNQIQKKQVFKQTEEMLTQGEVSQLQNTQNVVAAIGELLENEMRKEANNKLLKWLEPSQESAKDLIQKESVNAKSCEELGQIIANKQSKLDALQETDLQFFTLTQPWEALAHRLVTGDIKQLTDFLTAINSVSPPSDIVMDLLQYAVEFGTSHHVKCLAEKYSSYVNTPFTKKENQPTILLLAYERLKSRNTIDHEPVHIFHYLLNRDDIDINVPNHDGNTLLHLMVANEDTFNMAHVLMLKKKIPAAINQPNKQHHTVLCQAVCAKTENSEMINLLLKNGATLGSPEKLNEATIAALLAFQGESENTLLHLAVQSKNLPLVKQLVALKRTEDVAVNYFTTPLIDRINSDSKTALSLAREQGGHEIAKSLEGAKNGNRFDFCASISTPENNAF